MTTDLKQPMDLHLKSTTSAVRHQPAQEEEVEGNKGRDEGGLAPPWRPKQLQYLCTTSQHKKRRASQDLPRNGHI